jgi:hypothetical protein
MGQLAVWLRSTLLSMATDMGIISVEQDGGDGLIVAFSDGTIGAYVIEELLELRPCRESAHELGMPNPPQISAT